MVDILFLVCDLGNKNNINESYNVVNSDTRALHLVVYSKEITEETVHISVHSI